MNGNYKYKIAVFDIDGTLIDRNEVLFKGILEGLTSLKLQGVDLFLATGRNVRSIKDLKLPKEFFELFDSNFICNDGNVIYNYQNDKVNILKWVSSSTFISVIKNYSKSASFVVESNGLLYTNCKSALMKYKLIYRTPREAIKFVNTEKLCKLRDVTEVHLFYNENIINFQDIPIKYPDLNVYSVNHFNGIKLYPANSCKAEGLTENFVPRGINIENVIAFGDAENDITMLEKCGCGVAVVNCKEILNTIADLKLEMELGMYLQKWSESLRGIYQ